MYTVEDGDVDNNNISELWLRQSYHHSGYHSSIIVHHGYSQEKYGILRN